MENNNEVFLRVTNHTGRTIPAGPSRFFSACPVWFVTRRNTSLLLTINHFIQAGDLPTSASNLFTTRPEHLSYISYLKFTSLTILAGRLSPLAVVLLNSYPAFYIVSCFLWLRRCLLISETINMPYRFSTKYVSAVPINSFSRWTSSLYTPSFLIAMASKL